MNKSVSNTTKFTEYCLPVQIKIALLILGFVSSIFIYLLFQYMPSKNQKDQQEKQVASVFIVIGFIFSLIISLIVLKLMMMLCARGHVNYAYILLILPYVLMYIYSLVIINRA